MADATLIGGDGLVERGIQDVRHMRPVLNSGEDPFVTNATLRKDEWERIDEQVNEVFRERLTVVDDLRQRGLTEDLPLGAIIRRTERLSDMDDAEISFDGDTSPDGDRPAYNNDTRPVPVISKDFRINWRQLDASRTRGEPLDTTSADMAARKVRFKRQDLFANGLASGGPTGGGIPGFTSATNRLTDNSFDQWDGGSGTPVADVRALLQKAYNNNLFGPFVLYVAKNYWATIQQDHSVDSSITIRDRIMDYEDIDAVRPLDALADHNVVLVQMTPQVLDMSMAQEVTTVQWEKNPFVTKFRVLQVGGPHIKNVELDDGTVISGILHSDLS